jgi:hypothetical protein
MRPDILRVTASPKVASLGARPCSKLAYAPGDSSRQLEHGVAKRS